VYNVSSVAGDDVSNITSVLENANALEDGKGTFTVTIPSEVMVPASSFEVQKKKKWKIKSPACRILWQILIYKLG
jgi:hypothetical protein